ncbi:MAG: sigma-70 family RNA polymerase sigma factor [Verrucomicrobiota bacterium]
MMNEHPGDRPLPAPAPLDERTLRVQQLFVQHQGRLRAFVLGLVPEFSAADDVMQETFLVVSRKANEFDPDTNFQAWVRRIATFKVLSLHRDRQRAPLCLQADVIEALAAAAPSWDDEAQYLTEVRVLKTCIEKLPPAPRELIRLRYYGEHLPEEIARLRAQSVNAVNVTLTRARIALRECMERNLKTAGATP